MAIQLLEGPAATEGSVGKFDLPVGFDRKRFAGAFVRERDVQAKMQRERLVGAPVTADGWTPYIDPKTKKAYPPVVVSEGKFILMVRPRDVQDQVNTIYGNLGKQHALYEKEGATVAGDSLQDAGMIPLNRLKALGIDREADETPEAQFAPTPIPGASGTHLSQSIRT